MAKKLIWNISLRHSTRILFRTEIPYGCTSDKMIAGLLQALVAKEGGLTYDEICDCYTKSNTKRHATHLEVTTESTKSRFIMSCGSNPYATAVVNHGDKA